MKYYLTTFLTLILIFNTSFAQNDLRYAQRMMDEFKYDKAISKYESILKKSDSKESLLNLAECYRRVNDWKNAEKWYAKIVNSTNTSPDYIWTYVQLLQMNGKSKKANEWSKKLLADGFVHHENLFNATQEATINQLKSTNYYTILSFPHNSVLDDFRPIKANNGIIFHTLENDKINAEHLHESVFIPSWKCSYTSIRVSERPLYTRLEPYEMKPNRLHERGDLTFSSDDVMTYFTECYIENKKKNKPFPVFNLYQSLTNKNGKNAIRLPFNSNDYSIIHPFMSGDTLYFASDKPGGFGGMDLYFIIFKNERWSKPQNLGKAINTPKDEIFPFFNKKTNQLYFTSNGHAGLGGLDIYYALPFDNDYKNNIPVNLGVPINSRYDDHGFIFYKKKHGYFASNRPSGKGGTDIYGFLKIKKEALPQPKKDKTLVSNNEHIGTMTWISHQDDYSIQAKSHFDEKLKIELVASSNSDFFCTDIKLFINGEEYKSGKAGDCGDFTDKSKKINNTYTLNYEQEVTLSKQGNYKIVAQLYKFGETIAESRVLNISYKPQKINMHILSIGTSNKSLKYAENDAKDIVNAFETQENVLYNKVYHRLQLGEDTEALAISKGLNSLKNSYAKGQIASRDIVLVFISSHGYASENGTFYIQPNNFDKTELEYSAIPFNLIIDRLDSIKCAKILILDACHSGIEVGSLDKGDDENTEAARVLFNLLQDRDAWVIMSSSSKEKSWESEKWQNGAFTEALLEGLKGKADANRNGYISIGEWFYYAKKRARELSGTVSKIPQQPKIGVKDKKIRTLEIFKY
jgi:tetratricopeptide (TPR) repeat protein